MIRKYAGVLLVGTLFAAVSCMAEPSAADGTIMTESKDGITVHGETYFGDLEKDAPLVLLFHQARANGNGEYGTLAPWLNSQGFRVITWDARAGGGSFDGTNRTVAGLPEGTSTAYCDAYPDLQAALDHVIEGKLSEKVIIWGSSYSAALVFRLAAENPDQIAGVVSCSPATGGSMADCRARKWVKEVAGPVLVLRPESEMGRDSSVEQQKLFEKAGYDFEVIENGVHGSSMLVDERTEYDMSETRALVVDWLNKHSKKD